MTRPSDLSSPASTVALVAGASRHRLLVAAVTELGLRAVALRALPDAAVPASIAVVALDGEAERLSGYRSLAALRRLPGAARLPVLLAFPGAPPSDPHLPAGEPVAILSGDADVDEARALLEALLGSGSSVPRVDGRGESVPFGPLVTEAPLGMAVLSPDARVRFVNAHFLRLADRDEGEVRESSFGGLRARGPGALPRDLGKLRERRWTGAVAFEWGQGERELMATVERAPDGANWLLWVTEAPPSHRGEGTLSEAARMEVVERLAGGVAHDFNNILSVITTLSDLLIRLRPEGDPDLEDLEEILRSARRGSEITRQLSAFSRTAPGEPEEVDLEARLLANEKMFRRFLSEDIALVWALEGSVPAVRVDPVQLDQMILNLALNARDAMPRGGTITIGSMVRDLTERADVAGLVLEPGRYAVVTVTDTGEGMDEATRARLFEPFFTTRSWGRRSGLGLSVVHGTVRAMEGAIRVESELGRGTRFEILIPALTPLGQAGPGPEPPTGSETVLLVEDHVELRRGMRRGLDALGYRVVDAADGAEALSLVREGGLRPHLVVTDVVMPSLSGPELSAGIRDLGLSVPTLFLSGYTDHPAVERLRRAGVQVLAKPLEPLEVARAVRSALDRAAAAVPGPIVDSDEAGSSGGTVSG